MSDSLKVYAEAIDFAQKNPTDVNILRNYYLQLVTTIFYELTTQKNSPLMSALCQTNIWNFVPKNFQLANTPATFKLNTSFDMYVIVYGLNVALAENLGSCKNVYDQRAATIFRGLPLPESYGEILLNHLILLDEELGKFSAAEKIVEAPTSPQPPEEKITAADDESDFKLLQTLAQSRHADDEKILDEIKKVQLVLQEELPQLQGALKKISDIRDGIDYATLSEPINQLIQLFDKLNETLQRHPFADTQTGYKNLLKLCRSFSRLIERSLAMLGAELINETNIPVDPDKHDVANPARFSESSTVTKILRVGLIYKGQILRKADVEISEPATKIFGGTKIFGR